jgi:hypothetical protein
MQGFTSPLWSRLVLLKLSEFVILFCVAISPKSNGIIWLCPYAVLSTFARNINEAIKNTIENDVSKE